MTFLFALGLAAAYLFILALFLGVWDSLYPYSGADGGVILAATIWPIAAPIWAGFLVGKWIATGERPGQ